MSTAQGPPYPSKQIRMIVPFPPGQGVDVRTGTPEQFGGLIKSEVERWAKVIKEAGIRAD